MQHLNHSSVVCDLGQDVVFVSPDPLIADIEHQSQRVLRFSEHRKAWHSFGDGLTCSPYLHIIHCKHWGRSNESQHPQRAMEADLHSKVFHAVYLWSRDEDVYKLFPSGHLRRPMPVLPIPDTSVSPAIQIRINLELAFTLKEDPGSGVKISTISSDTASFSKPHRASSPDICWHIKTRHTPTTRPSRSERRAFCVGIIFKERQQESPPPTGPSQPNFSRFKTVSIFIFIPTLL
eukprot:3940669-Rhodomonas_salina.4